MDTAPLVVFTDGSCLGNGRTKSKPVAGFATVWPDIPEFNYASLLQPDEVHTNNRSETRGIIHAFEQADTIDPTMQRSLHVYTDSMLLVNSINSWMPNWKKKNWIKSDGKEVMNQDLLKNLDQLLQSRPHKIFHVKAHTKETTFEAKWNAVTDDLAQNICRNAANKTNKTFPKISTCYS